MIYLFVEVDVKMLNSLVCVDQSYIIKIILFSMFWDSQNVWEVKSDMHFKKRLLTERVTAGNKGYTNCLSSVIGRLQNARRTRFEPCGL